MSAALQRSRDTDPLGIMFRRLRAALSLASLWAAVWLPAGIVLGFVFGWTGHSWRLPLWYPVVWTLLGASCGAVFAFLLAALGRQYTLNELSPRQIALWGATVGAALPVGGTLLLMAFIPGSSLTQDATVVFALMALLGGVCAWASLKIAQRGETLDA
jgi:hypothetical protein